MAKQKVTFANGVTYVYDTEVNSHPTGYGDEHGVTHAVVSSVPVGDDEEPRFEHPSGKVVLLTAGPAPVEDNAAKAARLRAELAELES